jgi:hypothetical protein
MSTEDIIAAGLAEHRLTLVVAESIEAACGCGERFASGAQRTMRAERHQAHAIAERLVTVRSAQWRNTVEDAEDGDPWWRVVITDSESMTGLAPICVRQDERESPHDHGDEVGLSSADRFDLTGVYDCCPEPHIETYSVSTAAFLVEVMNLRNVRMCT